RTSACATATARPRSGPRSRRSTTPVWSSGSSGTPPPATRRPPSSRPPDVAASENRCRTPSHPRRTPYHLHQRTNFVEPGHPRGRAALVPPTSRERSPLVKGYPVDRLRNVALISHGGAGKTQLAEVILHAAGLTDRLGRVDAGNSVLDFDPDEIERRVSIQSSLAPIPWKDHKINLIDTPGYFDF